jgi:uncharacterized protein (DUF1684 family)
MPVPSIQHRGKFYNGIHYASASSLRDAMDSPDFEICPHNRDGAWTDTEDLTAGHLGNASTIYGAASRPEICHRQEAEFR